MRKQMRFRCAAQRGWYFVTGEGCVGFFDTRQKECISAMHVKKLLPNKKGRKAMKLITHAI
ncbi:hypothetical protein [Nitrosococcus watsonii]|uniref:Uncharacterized protein n=1 Tax=Nitrosococcus watsoni (strain C-113) TaxID=105559 RepID=D8K561_NITWC|nr:hypothetical protein [Nitrosococcus watsonii]ADJ28038.1 hypothetical protein Nwat_1104 [Nitrosococcus watsonii C-113]